MLVELVVMAAKVAAVEAHHKMVQTEVAAALQETLAVELVEPLAVAQVVRLDPVAEQVVTQEVPVDLVAQEL